MRFLIFILLLAGCSHQSLEEKYPVTARFGLHTYSEFQLKKCVNIDPEICEMMFWHRFAEELFNHYGDTGFNYKTCSLTDLCLNDISFETEYRK